MQGPLFAFSSKRNRFATFSTNIYISIWQAFVDFHKEPVVFSFFGIVSDSGFSFIILVTAFAVLQYRTNLSYIFVACFFTSSVIH